MIGVNSKEKEWENPPRGYYLTDVKQKVLWVDEETGATMALVKFPVGVADEVHRHSEANQLVYGLTGEVEMPDGDRMSLEGVFTYTPKGENRGATKFTKKSILLFYWDGSPSTG